MLLNKQFVQDLQNLKKKLESNDVYIPTKVIENAMYLPTYIRESNINEVNPYAFFYFIIYN